jgi:hypothetical protein
VTGRRKHEPTSPKGIFFSQKEKKVERLVVTSILSEKKKVSEALLFFLLPVYTR